MPSAIELSVKFGIAVPVIERLCRHLGVDLDEENFETSREFETIAKSIKRGRYSAYAMTYLDAHCTDEQIEFALTLSPDFALEYDQVGFPIEDHELLKDAKALLDRLLAGGARSDWGLFEQWLRTTLSSAQKVVRHSYIAARLLRSLPEKDWRDYSSTVAKVMNKLRHRGYLESWFRLVPGEDGKNIVEYFDPDLLHNPAPWVGQRQLDMCREHDPNGNPASWAQWLSDYRGGNPPYPVEPIRKALQIALDNWQKTFDL